MRWGKEEISPKPNRDGLIFKKCYIEAKRKLQKNSQSSNSEENFLMSKVHLYSSLK